jgi:hypothetical protein
MRILFRKDMAQIAKQFRNNVDNMFHRLLKKGEFVEKKDSPRDYVTLTQPVMIDKHICSPQMKYRKEQMMKKAEQDKLQSNKRQQITLL